MRRERARAYIIAIRSTATRSEALDQLVAALQNGVPDEAAARQLYALGPHAVTLALLAAARRIAEQDARLAELQTQAPGPVSPSTPSGMRPVYTKPNAPRGRRRKRPGARAGHPGHRRPTPARIDARQEHRLPVCPGCGGPLQRGQRRGEVPLAAAHVTMFIDVQAKALFWLVAAWESDFTGYILDYGTEPDQKAEYFTLRDIRRTLATSAPRAGIEGAIYAGLERLTERTLGREWQRDDASTVRIDRCLIDANWGQSTDVVYQFCRQSSFAGVVMPSHGRYVGASSIPFSEYKRKRGDRIGLNWHIPAVTGRRTVRHVVFDTNYWKSFIHARLAVPMGDPGSLSLFGRQPERHRLLAEHLTSEYRVKTEGRGRTVDEWKLRVNGLDNHWLDGLVGCAVAASIAGAAVPGLPSSAPVRRRRVSLRELARRAQRATW